MASRRKIPDRLQEYALEHTKVQPFGNRIELTKLWHTARNCAEQWFPDPLPGSAFCELYIPLGKV